MAVFLILFQVDNPDAKETSKPHQWETGDQVLDGIKNYFYVDTFDASKILFFYIFWNIVSSQLHKIHQKCSFSVIKPKRVSESIWRCVYEGAMVSYGSYHIFTASENLILKPNLAWQAWGDSDHLSDCLQIFFLMQLSFHIYSVTYLLKEAKKEHHAYSFLTLHTLEFIMIALFYTLHYYEVGLLVCLFYDTPALAIEITRINVYFERVTSIFRYFSYLSFSMYTTLWLCNTLYLYPTKVLYFGVVSTMDRVDRPLVETVTFGLILLQLFNLYWLLILLQWMKRMIKPRNRTRDYFVIYCFFHKRGMLKCSRTPPTPISDDERSKTEAKALVQTVKCVIRLKRKLKRIRTEVNDKMEETELISEPETIEIDLDQSDTLTIDFVSKKNSLVIKDDEQNQLSSKSDIQELNEGGQGEMKALNSNEELMKFASFTSAEESRSSSDLSLKEV